MHAFAVFAVLECKTGVLSSILGLPSPAVLALVDDRQQVVLDSFVAAILVASACDILPVPSLLRSLNW